jgi:nucleotide-binding universal stress UspA family protein
MTRPIVVAVSEEEQAHEAVALGVAAARLMDAPLVLAGIAVTPAPGGATVVPGWSPASRADVLTARVADAVAEHASEIPADVTFTIHVLASTGVVPGLEHIVEQENAQLLVVGGSHLGSAARALRGDIGVGAARHTGCAVLALPTGRDGVAAPPRRIGVAWDGDLESDAALDIGAALAARGDGTLTVLRAFTRIGDEHAVREALELATTRVGEHVPCTVRALPGATADVLVAASVDLDLLVVGAHDRSTIATILMGSVSATLVRHARCPVLVVPHGARVTVPS